MQIGYHLSSEEHPASDLVGYARRAEESGFDYAVISDHFHPWLHRQGQSPFAWSVLGAIAQVTNRIRVGTAVTAPIQRMPPYLVAQAAATVTTLMPGRFFLGVGSGENLNEHVTGEWWPPSETRREMLEEAIEVIRKLFAGGTVEHFGKHYTVDNARIYSRPLEPPAIMVSAGGKDGAELAGRIGDGLIGTAPSEDVVQAFEEAGGEGKPRYAQIDVCVAEDEAEARRVAHAQWAAPAAIPPRLLTKLRVAADFQAVADLVTEEQVSEKIICGSNPDEHLAKIQEFAAAGFDHVHVHQVGADQESFFRFYEKEMLPRIEER
ncbi:MAG: TIGR03557 family F420-dependent LLM class oxidoreductase [Actinomycetota bacterium]|nr:TIGR03557 family F420-dependent LLM class oxidoreductase [Actinomycetota bacterium]